ncbi:type II toxin-antitoxin system VapC family toxin [Terracidiphilus sp.]|jgi:PIN domain nuclease of toxin-antitoxin system|uniref:type II toxin-antitoxin system VapC family toxin n=1 Tax=Terracidiphilus sp. TaxID=1964191 RepID=UPI003C235E04
MNLLLDTHVFLWWDTSDTRLPNVLEAAIALAENSVFVSAASIWEISIKRASEKLKFSGSAAGAIRAHGFSALPISVEHAEWAGELPLFHRDPFDRLLVAQAQIEGLTLVTVDEQILKYPVVHL